MSSYRLRNGRLQEAAAARGDHTNYAIAKRTGLNQTTLSRVCRGLVKPAAETLLTLATAYGLSIDELIDRDVDDQIEDGAEGAGAAPMYQIGASAGNDEATQVPAGPPLSSKSTTTAK